MRPYRLTNHSLKDDLTSSSSSSPFRHEELGAMIETIQAFERMEILFRHAKPVPHSISSERTDGHGDHAAFAIGIRLCLRPIMRPATVK